MAEKVRFELTVLSYTRVPGVHLKPLGHLSAYIAIQQKNLLLFKTDSKMSNSA